MWQKVKQEESKEYDDALDARSIIDSLEKGFEVINGGIMDEEES